MFDEIEFLTVMFMTVGFAFSRGLIIKMLASPLSYPNLEDLKVEVCWAFSHRSLSFFDWAKRENAKTRKNETEQHPDTFIIVFNQLSNAQENGNYRKK